MNIEFFNILQRLSARKARAYWYRYNNGNYICNLCDLEIANNRSVLVISAVRQHGIKHIKDAGLLPFL